MAFDANGTFNRVIDGGWVADAAAGTKITAIRHDLEDDGFAAGLTNCITKDGRTQPLANIPMANKKIINLGEPENSGDAATKNYVDNFKTFGTGVTVGGAGPINGFINFTAPNGVNGIGWATADMSWIGRTAEPGKWNRRLAVNDAKDGTGGDVFAIDESGRVNSIGHYSNNLVLDDAALWRAPAAGIATSLSMSGGAFTFMSNDTATAGPYLPAGVRTFASLQNGGGSTYISLDKSGSGKGVRLTATNNGVARWVMDLGNTAAEGADRVGSDFALYSCNNAGSATPAMTISRLTNAVNFPGALTGGSVTSGGHVVSGSGTFQSTAGLAVLACGSGSVSLRPNGIGSTVGQAWLSTGGDWNIPEGSVIVSGGGTAGQNGITLNEAGYGDFARAGTGTGMGFCRFLNNNGIIGSITSASATSVAYATTSDERLKDVKGDYAADAAIAIIRADPVKSFTWKASGEEAVGWLAQRSYAVDKSLAVPPELASDGRQVDENDRWGIDYGARTPYLWAALAAALDKIDVLTARIEALEAAP